MSIADKLTTVAENQQKVYDAGVEIGVEQEKQTFWDEYQKKGKRTNYYYGFGGYGWHDRTFYPRYDIKPSGSASSMFFYFGQQRAVYVDFVERLKECGVTLDFVKCTKFSNAFAYAMISRLGVVDTTGATDLTKIFANAAIETIEELRLNPKGGQTFTNAFFKDGDKSQRFININVTGEITKSIDLGQCRRLSKASIESFFKALSLRVEGTTLTLSEEAVETSIGTSTATWQNLIATRPAWNINLV